MTRTLCIITVVILLIFKYPDASGQWQKGGCQDEELGMGNGYILDKEIISSSVQNTSTPAKNARLNYTAGSSWCAAANDSKPHLQINLDRLYIICAVSTQGNSQREQWVTRYTLQSSKDGTTWTDYQEAGIVTNFKGNFDGNTTVKHLLCNGIVATHLRIITHDHHGNCCMRVEMYGFPVGIVNPCTNNPCKNGATCKVTGDDTYSCQCPDGFEGDNCETSKISKLEIAVMSFFTLSM
ncbi:retinoschisin-like [Oculina patagonica]